MSKPVLFVTNHAPPFRVGAFAALHERENVVFALIGGDVRHGGGGTGGRRAPVPGRSARAQRAVARLAASGRYRAVVAGLSGRVALPAAYAGARAGPRPVRAVGDDLGAPAHPGARALLPPAAPPLPPRGRDRHLRPARQRLRAHQAPDAARSSRRRRASTTRSGARRPSPSAAATSRSCSPAGSAPEKGVDVLLEAARRRRHARAGRRRSAAAAGAIVLGTRATGRSPQPLRGQRRCGRTVDPHARLPRAVGARRQRSLPPGSPRDRHRRRRSRRRRARAPRAHRPRRPRGRRAPRCAPRCTACTTTRRCARGSARTRRDGGRARTPTTPGREGMSRALAPWAPKGC